jgi:hypothetical protein
MKVKRQKLKEMLENNSFPAAEIQMNASSQTPSMTAPAQELVESRKNK